MFSEVGTDCLNHFGFCKFKKMRPSYHPERLNFGESKVSSSKSKRVTQLWHTKGRCPEGTIPVRRTKQEDILRASSIKSYGKKKQKSFPQPRSADPDLLSQSGHQVLLLLQLVLQLFIIIFIWGEKTIKFISLSVSLN